MFRDLFKWIKPRSGMSVSRRKPRFRPSFEALEGRLAPAVLTVNTIADNTTSDDFFTLREALAVVNGNLGRALTSNEQAQVLGALGTSDTIEFALPAGPQTIKLSGGSLSATTAVSIDGPGIDKLTVDGNSADRVFVVGQIYSEDLSLVVSMSGFGISGGSATTGSNNYGAGLLNFGKLTLSDIAFSKNSAGSSGGGAIYNVGSLDVSNSTFTSNSAGNGGAGAGILNVSSGTLNVTDCTFSANTTTNGGSGAGIANSGVTIVDSSVFANNTANSNGAGIFNSETGTLTVSGSSFTNNSANSSGGGIDNDGTMTVSTSLFANNSANSDGGGIDNKAILLGLTDSTLYGNTAQTRGGGIMITGAALIENCTITGNRVITGGGTKGGGITDEDYDSSTPGVPAILFNTIVAGNFAGASPSTTPCDIVGGVNLDPTSASNLIGSGGSGGLSDGINNNQVGVTDPGLGGLGNNGGPTQTVSLLSGSPAIDQGDNSYVASGDTDQRGFSRIVNSTVDIGAFEVQPNSIAAYLSVTGFPTTTTAGVASSFTVTAYASSNIATGYTGTVTIGSTDPNASFTPISYAFTPADNGVHTFSATLKTVGSQSLTAADSANNLSGSEDNISVVAADPASLVVSGFPSPTTAGAAHTFTVTAKDAYGNISTSYAGSVTMSSSDGSATFTPGSYTFNSSDAGTHTFSATLNTTGSQSLIATDSANSLVASQTGISVLTTGTTASLVLSTYPSPTTAGAAHTFTITAKDNLGNVNTAYTGTVTLSSSDSSASFSPSTYTFNSSDAGVHTFSATLKSAGSQSITATDSANSLIVSQNNISVVAGKATNLVVTGYPTPTTAGAAHTFTVTAKDSAGNIATGYTGTVSLTGSDGGASFSPSSYTFNSTDAGTHTFSATLKTVGSQSLTATDSANTLIGSQTGITVNAGAASIFIVTGYPTSTTAGVAHNFTVTAKDSSGNIATGYTGTVALSSSDGSASFTPSSYTFNSTDAGTHTFSATLKSTGTQSITATDSINSSLSGSQTGISVAAAAPVSLVVSLALGGFPSPTTAGVAHNFTVTAKDSFGNVATSYAGSVTLSSSDILASITPVNYTFNTTDAGTHTFSANLKTAGIQSLTATDSATSSLTGSQTGIVVVPAAASSLVVAGYPTPTTAGVAHNFTVTAKDSFGNVATGYAGAVTLGSSDGGASFTPTGITFNSADAGVHIFSAALKTAGTQSITATDSAHSLSASQTGIVVTPAAAASFVLAGFPTPTSAGAAHTFTVTAKDAFGNIVSGYTGSIALSSSDSQASFTPTSYTFNGADAGVHTFSAALKSVGNQSIIAKDTVVTSIVGSQSGMVVNAASKDAVLIVNSTADNTTSDKFLTLREAILYVNGTLGRSLSSYEAAQVTGPLGANNSIQFNLPSGPQSITLTGGALSITKAVAITGPGSSLLTVSGNNSSRVFIVGQVWSPKLSLIVAISGLTIAKGSATNGNENYGAGLLNFGTLAISNAVFSGNAAGSGGGGGIYNVGALTVTTSTFTGNSSTKGGDGGAILNNSAGTLTVTGCTFSNNTSPRGGSGAGIANSGLATVSNSTFSSNTADSNGAGISNSITGNLTVSTCTFSNGVAGSNGCGIFNDGKLTVSGSTFNNNAAGSEGGAIENHGTSPKIINSTFVANTAASRGGAICSSGSLLLVNCTLTGNRVTTNSSNNFGGGLYVTGSVTLRNTIVAGNFRGAAPGTTASDVGGSLNLASSFNLIGTGGSGGLTNGVNSNQVGVSNAGLGTLANNGGPVQTIALLTGSSAINRGSNTFVVTGETDERGLLRIVNGTVDIGAFEVQ